MTYTGNPIPVMNASLWPASAKRVGCFALFGCFTVLSQAQNTLVLERGRHHAVVQETRPETNLLGEVTQCISQYTILENGLNYWDAAAGQWAESQELFEVYPQGLVAKRGQYQVVVAPNVNSSGAVDLLTPDLLRLRGNCLGLAWYDAATGTAVWLATVRNTVAELLSPNFNQVVFRDSFEGAIKADLIYSYRKGSFEQDLVIREISAGPPSAFGLADETSRLIVVTEWLDPPEPQIAKHIWKSETDAARRAQMLEPDLTDETLSFGADMQMILGKAFPLEDPSTTATSTTKGIPVFKSWRHLDAQVRDILLEAVEYPAIKTYLDNLPQTAVVQAKALPQGKLEDVLPPPRSEEVVTEPPRVASQPYVETGVVIDYVVVVSQATYNFLSGTTYLVQGAVTISQSTTIQSASYIKFATNAELILQGSITTPSSGQAAAILTSRNDDWVGETLSVGTLNYYYANPALSIYLANAGTVLNNLEIRYAKTAIDYYSASPQTIQNSKFVNCTKGIGAYYTTVNVLNNTKCYVPTFTYNYGSATFIESGTVTACGEVNTTHAVYNQYETEIAINPANPNNIVLFAISEAGGLYKAYSMDGGATWTTNGYHYPDNLTDPSVAFDRFGNLYLAYMTGIIPRYVQLDLSIDGGANFSPKATFNPGTDLDFPKVRAGPGVVPAEECVWLACTGPFPNPPAIGGWGAHVLGLNNIGNFFGPFVISGPSRNVMDLAIGPSGEVVAVYQDLASAPPSSIYMSVNTAGINQASFTSEQLVTTTSVLDRYHIDALPTKGINAAPGLAWDRTGEPTARLYFIYTDLSAGGANNTDVFLRWTDNPTAPSPTWSQRKKINDDSGVESQFFPRVAVDQTTGKLAVSWYDCRSDPGLHRKTEFFATISKDRGAIFLPNIRVSGGQSDAHLVTWLPGAKVRDYGDYTGLAFHAGFFVPAWADNSNSTANQPNPDGTAKFDIYIKKVSAP